MAEQTNHAWMLASVEQTIRNELHVSIKAVKKTGFDVDRVDALVGTYQLVLEVALTHHRKSTLLPQTEQCRQAVHDVLVTFAGAVADRSKLKRSLRELVAALDELFALARQVG